MEAPAVTLANCISECVRQIEPLVSARVATSDIAEPPAAAVEHHLQENVPKKVESENPAVVAHQMNDQSPKCAPEMTLPVAPVHFHKYVGKYRLLRTIGKGNFAKVKLAVHIATGVEVAIKIVNKTTLDGNSAKRLNREMNIMKSTNHPNIVKLLEVIENQDVMCLVMEYASGGEIFDYLVAHGRVSEREAREKFRQLLSAIQYCHSKRIVHRDLKAENILLDPNLNVKVADFGLANKFEVDQRLNTFCGSPPYAAPELFLGVPYYGPGVDIWSLGVLLFTLVIGHLPFDARNLHELRCKVIALNYTIPKGVVSAECEALLRKMLVLDPKDRSSLKALMLDKWVNMTHEHDLLRPYKEPQNIALDEDRVKIMESLGYTRADLEASVLSPEFDHVYATYQLIPDASAMQSPSPALKPSAEIGRFTVAPSSAAPDNSRPRQRPGLENVPPVTETQPRPDTAIREHHSLTSTLPLALRKAFAQMGRTLAGGGSAVPPHEINARAFSQTTSGRTSNKAAARTNGTRNVITAAPVPIVSAKKSQSASAQAKRASPGPQVLPTRTATTDSSSTPITAMSLKGHTSTSPTAAVVPVVGIHRPDSSKKTPKSSPSTQSQRLSQLRSSQLPTTALKESPQRSTQQPLHAEVVSTPRSSTTAPTQPDSKSGASSSSSSDSHRTALPRQRSASSVQDVWLSTDLAEKQNPKDLTSSPQSAEQAVPADSTARPSVAADARAPFSPHGWSPQGESHSALERPTPTSSHTVHGNEASALLGEALRVPVEPASRSVANTVDANVHTVDGSHGNTWSRGVFKAFGSFFGPTKPQEVSGANPAMRSGPRVVRFPNSVKTTSQKTAEELLACVVNALEMTQGCRYAYHNTMPFLLLCSWAENRAALRPTPSSTDTCPPRTAAEPAAMFDGSSHCGERDDPLHFEMEVCQLPRLHLRGVRVKRIRGSAIQFREVARSVFKVLHL